MPIGPVEYIIIEFPGNQFHGDIVPAIAKLIENETVRIIDLIFIMKDPDGPAATYEYDQLDELALFASLHGELSDLVNQEDVDYAAASLAPNTSAAVIVWEDTWATELSRFEAPVEWSERELASRPNSSTPPWPTAPTSEVHGPTTITPSSGSRS